MNSSKKTPGSLATWMAFGLGLPLGVALLVLVTQLPPWATPAPGTETNYLQMAQRYLEHPVEHAEVVLFFCALGGLLGKILSYFLERRALSQELLPAWNGKPEPVGSAPKLRAYLERQPGRVQTTFLGRRVRAVVDFVDSRGAAHDLDDQLRCLADNDAMTVESSYALLRFITWAIPILGFLGTVLGITSAIYGVTPEILEKDLGQVTGGLATAFDTTALALLLTMILMFFSFLVEKFEQNILTGVDEYVDDQLAHRFERLGLENNQFVETVRQNTRVLVDGTQALVERQAEIWAQSLGKVTQAALGHEQQLGQVIADALETTLASHAHRLDDFEAKLLTRTQTLFEGFKQLAGALQETSRQQQQALLAIADKVAGQTDLLVRLHENEGQLLQLQQALQNNLAAITSTGTFEQAVQSLTAAIHLMTTRVHSPRLAA